MFVFSVRADRKRLTVAAVITLVAVGMAVLALCLPKPQSVGGRVTETAVATAEDRAAFLLERGYRVTGETVREIRIPDELDEALLEYDRLQTAGMGLADYAGKRVKLYTLAAVKDETTEHTIRMYVYRNRLIAGDITESAFGSKPSPLT